VNHTNAPQRPEKLGWFQQVRHWLSRPSSELLPPIFGDPVPPDLKVFQAEVEEARHAIQRVSGQPGMHAKRSKPARHRKSSIGNH
jgi:hypothetical protein